MSISEPPLMLTVSGARGIVGVTMTPAVAAAYAGAFGEFLTESTQQGRPLVCVGRDSRPSGRELAEAAIAGLASSGCDVIDLGIVATPTVGVVIGSRSAAGGMVVTASHNPIEWNGLKCLNAAGVAPPPEYVEKIIERFEAMSLGAIPDSPDEVKRESSATEMHVDRVLAALDTEPIRAARFKVVLDSVSGAGCEGGRLLLQRLGCDVVHMNGEPTGIFPHAPEPLEENLRDLATRTASEHAACGFAQDPDADRLAIIDETGRYIGEEYTLVLAARALLRRKGSGVLAANLSTSRMIDDLAAVHPGSRVLRTAVGEANVANAMKQSGAIIGGEGNGGVIFPPPHGVCWVRDSLSAMALVLDLLATEKRPLSELVDEMPRYAMVKCKFDLADFASASGAADADIAASIERVKRTFADERIDTSDGVRIDFADGWVHLRSSNTEPIVRIIAEAKTEQRANELVEQTRSAARVL